MRSARLTTSNVAVSRTSRSVHAGGHPCGTVAPTTRAGPAVVPTSTALDTGAGLQAMVDVVNGLSAQMPSNATQTGFKT